MAALVALIYLWHSPCASWCALYDWLIRIISLFWQPLKPLPQCQGQCLYCHCKFILWPYLCRFLHFFWLCTFEVVAMSSARLTAWNNGNAYLGNANPQYALARCCPVLCYLYNLNHFGNLTPSTESGWMCICVEHFNCIMSMSCILFRSTAFICCLQLHPIFMCNSQCDFRICCILASHPSCFDHCILALACFYSTWLHLVLKHCSYMLHL